MHYWLHTASPSLCVFLVLHILTLSLSLVHTLNLSLVLSLCLWSEHIHSVPAAAPSAGVDPHLRVHPDDGHQPALQPLLQAVSPTRCSLTTHLGLQSSLQRTITVFISNTANKTNSNFHGSICVCVWLFNLLVCVYLIMRVCVCFHIWLYVC